MIYTLVFLAGGMVGCAIAILVMALCHMAHNADAEVEEEQKTIAHREKHS
ncbi:hypothetical protein [Candidatus Sodalis sp. SoCistrobi]|nr:hypothetical protein [Candidatus Sodalis sp. SoCistrobi]